MCFSCCLVARYNMMRYGFVTIGVTVPVLDGVGGYVGADKCELSERFHLQD